MVKGSHHTQEWKKNLSNSIKGINHPFFGKKHSEETKIKISLTKKNNSPAWNKGLHTGVKPWVGKRFTEEHKKNLSLAHKGLRVGEKNNMWKGGITSKDKLERAEFNKTIQKLIFERDNYTCQICNIKGGFLQVDHIQSWAEFKELRFNPENCRTLCMNCHYQITWGKSKPTNTVWGHNLKRRVSLS